MNIYMRFNPKFVELQFKHNDFGINVYIYIVHPPYHLTSENYFQTTTEYITIVK